MVATCHTGRRDAGATNATQPGMGPGRSRGFVKAQDGSDAGCAFCVTSRLRSRARSGQPSDALSRAKAMVREGRREIVLTGLSLGAYGDDLEDEIELKALVGMLLDQTDVGRVRFFSIKPWHVADDFCEMWANPRVCPHLHVPLRAGCEATLERTGRPIATAEFARVVRSAWLCGPEIAVTTDMHVGFAGEDEGHFRARCEFAESIEFAGIHVFAYSRRPATPAASLPHGVLPGGCKKRAHRGHVLGSTLAARYASRFVGETMGVPWERGRDDAEWRGLASNYLRVTYRARPDLRNRIVPATLVRSGCG